MPMPPGADESPLPRPVVTPVDKEEMRRLSWALARQAIESDPSIVGYDFIAFQMLRPREVDALTAQKARMYEATANHLIYDMRRYDALRANGRLPGSRP